MGGSPPVGGRTSFGGHGFGEETPFSGGGCSFHWIAASVESQGSVDLDSDQIKSRIFFFMMVDTHAGMGSRSWPMAPCCHVRPVEIGSMDHRWFVPAGIRRLPSHFHAVCSCGPFQLEQLLNKLM
jgi:hypothetical protein